MAIVLCGARVEPAHAQKLTFDHLKAIDLALHLVGAPRVFHGRRDGGNIFL